MYVNESKSVVTKPIENTVKTTKVSGVCLLQLPNNVEI